MIAFDGFTRATSMITCMVSMPPIPARCPRTFLLCGDSTVRELQRHQDVDLRLFFAGLLGIAGGIIGGVSLSIASALVR